MKPALSPLPPGSDRDARPRRRQAAEELSAPEDDVKLGRGRGGGAQALRHRNRQINDYLASMGVRTWQSAQPIARFDAFKAVNLGL